ncbi:IPT/TIG domain-containing protein [Parapedobacter deserti]|uniref:IPT/TIG domain-containing protein n=1 Tax=Parapedobacter deserti TaxID=1912957 RepID=A0ABV7JF23_9SPHI
MKTEILFTYSKLWLSVLLAVTLGACKKPESAGGETGTLIIHNFYPSSGKAGTLVTIEGTGFAPKLDKNTVTFGNVSGEIVALEDGNLVVRAPEGGQTSTITLSNGSRSQEVGTFTFQALSISRIDPANGPSGSHIRIYGEGFSSMAGPALVTINGKPAVVAGASDTLLVAEVPDEAGSGPIAVNVDGMSVRGQNFVFQAIRSVKPLTGGKGTRVRISGEGFETSVEGNLVDFNGKQAAILEASATSLLVEAPEGVETGPLALTVNGQRATGPIFTRVPLPVITEVSPLSGPAGTEMIIKGAVFSPELDENRVLINGVEVPVISATGEELKLILPGGTGSGKVVVMVNDQQTEGPHFRDQNLGIHDFSPDNGQDNLEITITGTGFDPNPAANRVTFNGVAAQVLAATDNELIVKTPMNVTTGTLQVFVGGQEAVAPREFRRTGVSTIAAGLPTVYSMVVGADGSIYALSGHAVIKLTAEGTVTTLAGNAATPGSQDGSGEEARFNFNNASGIVIDNQQNLYVSERNNNEIRKITPNGMVSRFVTLNQPGRMTMTAGNVILAEAGGNLHRISPQGEITRLVPNRHSLLAYPAISTAGIAIDQTGMIYFLHYWDVGYVIAFTNPATSQVEIPWAGGGPYGSVDGVGTQASFTNPNNIQADGNDRLLVSDMEYEQVPPYGLNILVRQIHIASREVSTTLRFPRGFRDGPLYEAAINDIGTGTMVWGPNGDIYFYQNNGQAIRRIFLR